VFKRGRSHLNDRVFKRGRNHLNDGVFKRGYAPLLKLLSPFPFKKGKGDKGGWG